MNIIVLLLIYPIRAYFILLLKQWIDLNLEIVHDIHVYIYATFYEYLASWPVLPYGVGGAVRFLVVGTIGQEERPPWGHPWEKNWPSWLLAVSSPWPKWSQPAVTWAVIELWPSRDWAVIILKMPWLSCDLAVIELWPSRDWAVTSPWLELWPLLAVTEPWSLGPEPRPPWSPWAHGDNFFLMGSSGWSSVWHRSNTGLSSTQ